MTLCTIHFGYLYLDIFSNIWTLSSNIWTLFWIFEHFFGYLNISIEKTFRKNSLNLIKTWFISIRISKRKVWRTCEIFEYSFLTFNSFHFIFDFQFHFIMILLFSFDNQFFEFLEICLLSINQHVDFEDYAVVLQKIKSIHEVRRKVWIICDRDRDESRDLNRRQINSRQVKCFFRCIAIFIDDIVWNLKMKNLEHNHRSSLIEAHSTLRRVTMTNRKDEITRQLIVRIRFFNVLSFFRIANNFHLNSSLNFMFINRNIYNLRAQMRRDALKSRTFIQTLIQKFDNEKEFEMNLWHQTKWSTSNNSFILCQKWDWIFVER